jgi:allophanate hydrolase subunit 2
MWELRVLPGPGDPSGEVTEVAAAVLQPLLGAVFSVLPRSDRMAVMVAATDAAGVSLSGGQQLSEACVSGTVQLPPDGNPVILLALQPLALALAPDLDVTLTNPDPSPDH